MSPRPRRLDLLTSYSSRPDSSRCVEDRRAVYYVPIMRALRLLLPALAGLALSAPAGAARINVTTTADEYGGGSGTGCAVREAVEAANTDATFGGCSTGAGNDTIRIPAGVYEITIPPTASTDPNPNDEGDFVVSSRVSVVGAGRTATILDGGDLDRLFYVDATAGLAKFSDLTLRDGNPTNPNRNGGAIYASSEIEIRNVLFLENNAIAAGGLNANARATVRDSLFRLNTSESSAGGAAFFAATTLSKTTFTRNTAIDNAGGFTTSQQTTRTSRVTVKRNEAGGDSEGGGIFAHDGKLVLEDSVVSRNDGGYGGGISALEAILVVRDSIVRGNAVVWQGGGLSSTGGRVTVTGSTFEGNNGAGYGGGLYVGEGGSPAAARVTIEDTTITANKATVAGGGINVNDDTDPTLTVTVSGTLIARNASGGYVPPGPFTGISDGIHNQAILVVRNSTITKNKDPLREGLGGGLLNTQFGTATLLNTTVTGNRASNADGDGDNLWNQGVLNVGNSIVGGASETGSCGGFAPLTSLGHNLEFETGGNRCFDRRSDRLGNPRLGSLASNGGTTRTLALRPGSAALGHGRGCTTFDQRGVPRSLGGRCDAGAYELVRCGGAIVNRVGTRGRDVLRGTRRADGMLGLGGSDRLRGLGGDDGLCGGDGRDELIGSTGADSLNGGAGRDVCTGGAGADEATACERRRSIP